MFICLSRRVSLTFGIAFLFLNLSAANAAQLGIFQGQGDVGTVLHPGSATYDAATGSYTVSGSGENMWFGVDDFHFVWTKVSGDISLSADVAFVGTTGNPHRKAVLMVRQTLDGDSPMVDIARHGVGLTSLQFRDTAGANTHEVESNVSGPKSVRIEKRGDYFYAFVSEPDGKLYSPGPRPSCILTASTTLGSASVRMTRT